MSLCLEWTKVVFVSRVYIISITMSCREEEEERINQHSNHNGMQHWDYYHWIKSLDQIIGSDPCTQSLCIWSLFGSPFGSYCARGYGVGAVCMADTG